MIKAILICMLFSAVSIEAIVNPGKCVTIPVVKDFNAAKYVGNWYEIERFNYIFEDFLKCIVATYGPINSTFVSVHNQGVNM
jgi:lipocalin